MTVARIVAHRIQANQLLPGDLYSTYEPKHWAVIMDKMLPGVEVFIRSNAPASEFEDGSSYVFKITIEQTTDSHTKLNPHMMKVIK